tara:strand:- start:98 stop:334 length:237 start_codon:yes stop_codon:yes gene_type:complete
MVGNNGEKMKIKVEKKIVNDEVVKTEELVFKLPKVIVEELKWEDGTLVEWERALDLDNEDETTITVLLRNIDDKIIEG